MTIFVELLRIKEFREAKAETEASRARLSLADATGAEARANAALAEYRAFIDRRERELYADLCTRIVRLRDIEDVQMSVLDLRTGERAREDATVSARKAREQAAKALDEANETRRLATRQREKFVEIARSFDEERVRELQRVEDLEMEEVHRVSQDREEREEWEAAHHD